MGLSGEFAVSCGEAMFTVVSLVGWLDPTVGFWISVVMLVWHLIRDQERDINECDRYASMPQEGDRSLNLHPTPTSGASPHQAFKTVPTVLQQSALMEYR